MPRGRPAAAVSGRPRGTVPALIALYACWGSSIPAMKLMVASVPPIAGAGLVFLLGGVVLGGVALRRARPTRSQALRATAAGVLLLVGGQGLATVVLTELTASLVAILVAAVPLWVVVLMALRGTAAPRASAVRLAVGFAGIALVVLTAPSAAIGGAAWAVAGVCIAPVLWAAGTVLASHSAAMPADRTVSGAIQLMAGGASLLLLAAPLGQLDPSAWTDVTSGSAAAGAFLLVTDSLAGFALYTYLLATASPQLASTYAYVTPLVAVALGATVLGEALWLGAFAGAAVIIGAVALEVRAHGA